ncbi:MAG: hypothetical protein HOV80_05645 [Polyangiaceae bacterium]|nr:hypothetical protein [Polyangiaceae bacterium]
MRAACREAWRFGVSPEALALMVDGGVTTRDRYSRALHMIERRRVVLETAPALKATPLSQLPEPASIDPWECDLEELPSSSYVTAGCPACGGVGKVGWQTCATCAGWKRVHAWLDVQRSVRQVICVHPRTAGASVHPGLERPKDFDARSWSARLLEDTGVRPPRSDIPLELQPRLDLATERLLTTRVQSFETITVRLTFSTLDSEGFIEVAGEPARVAPTSSWKPLAGPSRPMGSGMVGGSYGSA